MGQKTHPYSMRLGIIRGWQSHWIGKTRKDWRSNIKEDILIRRYLKKELKEAMVDTVVIERNASTVIVNVFVARPGIVIGRKGEGIEKIKQGLAKLLRSNKKESEKRVLKVNVKSVENPDTNADIVAKGIATAIEKRVPFRRVAKQTLDRLKQYTEVKGVKIQLAGRLDGADMARKEYFLDGSIPLQTLRADVDHAREEANTTHGVVGIKIWIYKGEIFKEIQGEKKQVKEGKA